MSPAATGTVVVAGVGFTLQVISGEVTSVTGELLTGIRTAAVDVSVLVTNVFQMSGGRKVVTTIPTSRDATVALTVSRGDLRESQGSGNAKEHHLGHSRGQRSDNG